MELSAVDALEGGGVAVARADVERGAAAFLACRAQGGGGVGEVDVVDGGGMGPAVPEAGEEEETSWGVRLLVSEMGMFSSASSRTPEQAASPFLISSDLCRANGIEASVNTTTPAWPRECAMTQSALILATSWTWVVMLLKSSGSLLGPGASTACQPMSGTCSARALATCCDVRRGSKPPMTMPEGRRARAWLKAAWSPAGVP